MMEHHLFRGEIEIPNAPSTSLLQRLALPTVALEHFQLIFL